MQSGLIPGEVCGVANTVPTELAAAVRGMSPGQTSFHGAALGTHMHYKHRKARAMFCFAVCVLPLHATQKPLCLHQSCFRQAWPASMEDNCTNLLGDIALLLVCSVSMNVCCVAVRRIAMSDESCCAKLGWVGCLHCISAVHVYRCS